MSDAETFIYLHFSSLSLSETSRINVRSRRSARSGFIPECAETRFWRSPGTGFRNTASLSSVGAVCLLSERNRYECTKRCAGHGVGVGVAAAAVLLPAFALSQPCTVLYSLIIVPKHDAMFWRSGGQSFLTRHPGHMCGRGVRISCFYFPPLITKPWGDSGFCFSSDWWDDWFSVKTNLHKTSLTINLFVVSNVW